MLIENTVEITAASVDRVKGWLLFGSTLDYSPLFPCEVPIEESVQVWVFVWIR